jgi:DNA-binding NtrC family response regulator
MGILLNYPYPGNIRELENIIEHAMVLCTAPTIRLEHLPMDIRSFQAEQRGGVVPLHRGRARPLSRKGVLVDDPLKVSEREAILRILEQTRWNYGEAARRLRKSRVTLWRKMKELGITMPKEQATVRRTGE